MSVLFYLKFFISVGIGDRRWTLTSYRKLDLFGLQLELLTWVNFNVICQASGWVVSNKTPVLDICSRRSEHLFDPDINQSALEATVEAISVIRHLRDKKSISWDILRHHKTSLSLETRHANSIILRLLNFSLKMSQISKTQRGMSILWPISFPSLS